MRIIPNNVVYFNRPVFCTKLFVVHSDSLSVFVILESAILHSTIVHFKCAFFSNMLRFKQIMQGCFGTSVQPVMLVHTALTSPLCRPEFYL